MLKQLRNAALGAAACLIAFAAPAAACSPPPGLNIYQYEAMCRQALVQMYPSLGGGLPYQSYVAAWYRAYVQAQNLPPGWTLEGQLAANRQQQRMFDDHNRRWSENFRR